MSASFISTTNVAAAADVSTGSVAQQQPRRQIRFDLRSAATAAAEQCNEEQNNEQHRLSQTPQPSPSDASTSTPVRRLQTPAPRPPSLTLELQPAVLLTPPHRLSDVFHRSTRTRCKTSKLMPPPPPPPPPTSTSRSNVGGFRKLTGLLSKLGFSVIGSRGAYSMAPTTKSATATANATKSATAASAAAGASSAGLSRASEVACQPLSYARLPGLVMEPYPLTGKRCSEI
ncbi:hypothetical protein BOX15_Mlig023361g2 [Macrostomum lignano]|nr:hypothetical protein BOX15_Mlig023361g2 [Macrostomum lignano]